MAGLVVPLEQTNTPRRLSVLELGGPAAHVYFVQHGSYAAQAQKLLGKEVVDKEYPMDHTHTAPFLADVVSSLPLLLLVISRFPYESICHVI
jgi:rhamnogalacturonan acetylesterase